MNDQFVKRERLHLAANTLHPSAWQYKIDTLYSAGANPVFRHGVIWASPELRLRHQFELDWKNASLPAVFETMIVTAESEQRAVHRDHPFYFRVMESDRCEFAPVVFMGGAFQSLDSWDLAARCVRRHTTAILVDPPGMGRSPTLDADIPVDFAADAIYSLLRRLGCQQVSIVTASYGSLIAFRFAQKYSELVSRLVLGGIVQRIPPHLRHRVRRHINLLRGQRLDEFSRDVIDGLMSPETDHLVPRRRVVRRVLGRQMSRLEPSTVTQYLANVQRLVSHPPFDMGIETPPSLVFTGEHDCFTTPALVREFASRLSSAVFTTIRNADHLFHLEQFETTQLLIHRFLAGECLDGISGCNDFEYFGEPWPIAASPVV